MDASKASTDSKTGRDPAKALVGDGVTFLPNHPGKVGSYSVQTFNGSQIMNSHSSASAAPVAGTTATSGIVGNSGGGTVISAPAVSGGAVLSKVPPASSSSVIQTPLMNSESDAAGQPVSQASPGPTVTLVRPPMQTAGSGATLNGSNAASPAVAAGATSQTRAGAHTPLVNSGQPGSSAAGSAGPHIIKAEPPTTIIQSAPQPTATPGTVSAPRPTVMASASAGGATAQMVTPRLAQPSPGQPSVHNIQLHPGMVLVCSESGQLLMIPQQALAQMQAQAQGGMAPRTATPTNVSTGQAPGNTIISRQVSPSTIIRQGCPAPAPLTATTTLHRPLLAGSVGATVPGMTPRTLSQTAGTTVTSVTVSKETVENVKKCKNFLSTLIKLASSGTQSTETAASVRELVKDLLEAKLEAEEFTSRLSKELKSSPQPYLVPFLKRSLPALRQLTPDAAAFIQQSQLPQPASGPAPAPGPVSSASSTSTTVVLGSPAPRLSAPICRPQLQPAISNPGQTTSLVLQPQQQRAILRPQVTLPTTPMMALRNQAPRRIVVGHQQVQLKELQAVPLRPEAPLVSKQISAAALTQVQKNKLNQPGSTFKDDDDINDVASMAGVNLSEESANILATNSGLVGSVTHSCKDEAFLSCALLQRRMLEIGRKHGVTELGTEVVNYVSHAAQHRLRDLLEKVSQVAQQKNVNFKEDENCEQISDVRAQLKFFEQMDQLEKHRKEEQEREILLKAAKSRARQEDPEQLRLKQKAKEMQQQELAQMRQREANLTALAAIGPRKKRKNLDSPSSSASAEGSGTGLPLTGGAGSSGSSRPTRQRITRVNLRDLLFCLENERFTSRSHFLYKGFLK